MSLTLSHEQTIYEPIEAGNHIARCIQIVDLGTQAEKAFESEEIKMNKKVRITWELPNEVKTYTDKESGEEKTRVELVGQEFKASLHEKAKLRKMLASWRGRDFTDEELKGFSLDKLIGVPCMINLTHTEKDGKKYVNIAAITPLAKGMTCPDQVNESIKFEIENYTLEVFHKLPEFVREKIKKSQEMQAQEIASSQPVTITDEFANMEAAMDDVATTQMPF